MVKNEVLDKRIAELMRIVKRACDDLDEIDQGVANYLPDSGSREMFLMCLNLFALYVGISDGNLDEAEVEKINEIIGTHYSKNDMKKIIEMAEINKDSFATQVPVILRTFVDADNLEDKEKDNCPLSVTLYDLFTTVGVYIMAANETLESEEYDVIMKYLKTMHKFIRQNLKFGFNEIVAPEKLVKQILDQAELEFKKTSSKKKSKEVKIEDSDDDFEEDLLEIIEEEEESLEDLIDELNSMIGLDEVKYDVTSLMNLLRIKGIREKMGLNMPPVSMHLVFSGNPGTGKTTVARLIAKIYKKIGVLSKGQLIEVDRTGLVGGYVGQTGLKTNDVIESAIGGVLFIDEAYALTPENMTNDYGMEAIDTLVKGMEDNREDLVVIVAGYPELMKHFLSANPGLKSRFNKFIEFRDYTPEELTQIFERFCKQSGYRASRPTLAYVKDFFEKRCAEKAENFANAREVRNLFEYALSRQANRVILIANPTQDDVTLLKRADVSGENINLGKQQFLAQMVMNDLSREKRYGIGIEHMGMHMDEFEVSAGAEAILKNNGIVVLGDLMNYLDGGNTIEEMKEMREVTAEEIRKALQELGFEG